MGYIKKVNEMALSGRFPKRTAKGKRYVAEDVWVCDKPGSDGYYPNFSKIITNDINSLVTRVLEESLHLDDVDENAFTYVVYPGDEAWVSYRDNGIEYQVKVGVVSDMTEKDMIKCGINSGMMI